MKYSVDEISQTDFESQFDKKEIMEFSGTLLVFVDISPTKDIDSVPIFFAPGWAEDKVMFKEVLHSFYRKNRRVLSLEHSTHTKNFTAKNGVPLVESIKAEEILAIIEHSNVRQVDAVFYSEGGINGILAAIRYPKKFRNIILVDPGGLIGKDSVLKLTWRFITEIIQWTKEAVYKPKERGELMQIEKEILAHVTQNPFISIKEANAIANGDSTEMLRALHHQSIGIVIIHSINDKVFPINKIQNIVDEGMVDYFYPVEGSHAELMVEPQKYVNLIIHAIDEVEQRKRA